MSTNISRRQLLGGLAAAPSLAFPAVHRPHPPNILLIMCDQLSLNAISAHGCQWARTPNIDRLAKHGVSFVESHSTNPVCSPARSSLVTGRMPVETGVISNNIPIGRGIPNIGEWLGPRGYETVYCGKWHLPEGWAPVNMAGFKVLPVGGHGQGSAVDPFNATACEAYLRNRSRRNPFLLVSSLMEPHDICYWCIHPDHLVPRDLPFPALEGRLPELPPNHKSRPKAPAALDKLVYRRFKSDEEWRYYLYAYFRMVEMLDRDVGRILDALEASGEAANTVVMFTSDHGEGGGRHSHVQKWYPYEEAVKVPLLVSWPGHVRQDARDAHLASGLDVVSTICDYAGAPAPPDARGRSLRPLLEGRNTSWREFVTAEVRIVGRMLRTERFKYVRYRNDPVEQLFDMQADPWEMRNLYEEGGYASELRAHRKLLEDYEATLKPWKA